MRIQRVINEYLHYLGGKNWILVWNDSGNNVFSGWSAVVIVLFEKERKPWKAKNGWYIFRLLFLQDILCQI